mmetsp:Transcript_25302/g.45823  ORF Transcript_25302/g.45823 Transcript_25302/m.45823 type:complete len:185 (+) Transcript_25302:247-801(+)
MEKQPRRKVTRAVIGSSRNKYSHTIRTALGLIMIVVIAISALVPFTDAYPGNEGTHMKNPFLVELATQHGGTKTSDIQTSRHLGKVGAEACMRLRGGWKIIPAGWNPFGYKITSLGLRYLDFDGSIDGDVGRFLASVKSSRKTIPTVKEQWLEVVRVSKKGQSMRIYRNLEDLFDFCISAGLID